MTACLGLVILGVTTPILALNEPARITSRYEVLEPETWIGKELPILKYIDIAEILKKGTWLILLYHYDCPRCREILESLSLSSLRFPTSDVNIMRQFVAISLPPHGPTKFGSNCIFKYTRLRANKKIITESPQVILTSEGVVMRCWGSDDIVWNNILKEFCLTFGNTGTHQNEELTPKRKKGESLCRN